MFLYIKTNILRGYGIFKNDFAHPREPANAMLRHNHNGSYFSVISSSVLLLSTVFAYYQLNKQEMHYIPIL